MNCTNLNTAAEILEAFRACNNPGEEIELFECLATRPDPPVGAFVEILRNIKLEAVLALTIQAFGKITDADIKARLKESQDLLTILSQQAQSGSSDLIRWSAATTIDNLGFDFIAVSQYLSEEPKKISEKIVQSKVKRFADQNLVNSNDYGDFALFWIYGALERLKQISLDSKYAEGSQIDLTCQYVMHYLDLKGIKDVNASLQRAESMGDYAFPVDENEVFEGSAQRIAKEKLEVQANTNELNILFENQLHCLKSNNLSTRKSSAQAISKLGNTFLEQLKQSNPTLAIAVFLFAQDWYQLKWIPSGKRDSLGLGLQELIQSYEFNSLSYNQLESVAQQFETLVNNFSRKKVKQDCQEWLNHALNEIQKRNQAFQARVNQSIALREKLDRQLNQIRDINRELYEQVFGRFSFDNPPQLSVENDNYKFIFNNYDKSLMDIFFNLNSQVKSFYSEYKSLIKLNINKADKNLEFFANIVAIFFVIVVVFIVFRLYIFILSFMWSGWWGIPCVMLATLLIIGLGSSYSGPGIISTILQCIMSVIGVITSPLGKELENKKADLKSEEYKLEEQERRVLVALREWEGLYKIQQQQNLLQQEREYL